MSRHPFPQTSSLVPTFSLSIFLRPQVYLKFNAISLVWKLTLQPLSAALHLGY